MRVVERAFPKSHPSPPILPFWGGSVGGSTDFFDECHFFLRNRRRSVPMVTPLPPGRCPSHLRSPCSPWWPPTARPPNQIQKSGGSMATCLGNFFVFCSRLLGSSCLDLLGVFLGTFFFFFAQAFGLFLFLPFVGHLLRFFCSKPQLLFWRELFKSDTRGPLAGNPG